MVEISSGISTINGLYKLTKLIMDGKVDKRAKEIASELYGSILPLQKMLSSIHADNLSLQIEKANITEEISNLNKWSETKSKYELKELAPGVFVYSYIKNMSNSEPCHYICAKCYKDKSDYILNGSEPDFKGVHFSCPSCGSVITDYSKKKEWIKPNVIR